MTTIGQTLAAAREQAGYTIAWVSERTRIRRSVLAAMERDDFTPCGGDFYARGHIRAVCRELGLEAAPLIEQFNEEQAEAPPMPLRLKKDTETREARAESKAKPAESSVAVGETQAETSEGDGRRRTSSRAGFRRRVWPLLVAAAIVVAGVIAGIQAWPKGEVEERGSAPMEPGSASGPTPEPPAGDRPEAQVADAGQDGEPEGAQATRDPGDFGEVHVKLRAQDRSWIRVTDADGGDVFTGVLTEGTQRSWSHPEELRMHLEDAGAVQVEANGENLGNAGTSGEVAHLVFDSEGVESR